MLMVLLQVMLLLELQVLKSLVFTKHHKLSLSTAHSTPSPSQMAANEHSCNMCHLFDDFSPYFWP